MQMEEDLKPMFQPKSTNNTKAAIKILVYRIHHLNEIRVILKPVGHRVDGLSGLDKELEDPGGGQAAAEDEHHGVD
jgi:hypothetical protein